MKIEKIYVLSGIFIGIVAGVISGVFSAVVVVGFSFGTLAKYGNSVMISVGTLIFILSLVTTYKIGKNAKLKENFVEQEEIKKAKIFLAVSVVILVLAVAGAFYLNEKSKTDIELRKGAEAECNAFNNARMGCYNECRDNQSCIIACNESYTEDDLYKKCNYNY